MTWISEIHAVWAKHVYDDLRERGLDAEAAIKACNIRRTALSNKHNMIPMEKHCALFDYAARVTGDDCYGLNQDESKGRRAARLYRPVIGDASGRD